jgi:hypothetical protein
LIDVFLIQFEPIETIIQVMTASTLLLMALVAMMCCSRPVSGLVYQTKDAIIMEGDDI